MIRSSFKLHSLLLTSLLFGSTSLSAISINDIVKTKPLPNIKLKQNNFAKSEVIITFKKDANIFKEKNKESNPSFFGEENPLDSFMKEFSTKFKDKIKNHFKVNTFKVTSFRQIDAMHLKSKDATTEELLTFFKSDEMKEYVESISLNNIISLSHTNDKYYSKLWAIENTGQEVHNKEGIVDADMDVAEAWAKTKGSQDVIVAVLDTGVDYTHSDLQDNMWNGEAKHGIDFAGDDEGNNDDDPMPDEPYDEKGHYHGTHVAGIIGAVGDNNSGVTGVAQHISIMALKVFRPNGYGYSSDILEALDYISKQVDNGTNIVAINASYGGSGGSQDDAMNNAIKKLGEQGVVFCAAAGNAGKDIDAEPTYPAAYNAKNIITVAASDQDDKLASFSNYGIKSVDVAAPGTNILSTYPGGKYAYMQGTSMATPNVTGSVALLASLYGDSTVTERKSMILDNVNKKDAFTNKILTEGRVNINAALNDAPEEQNTAPEANKDSVTTKYEETITIDVLKNDSDKDGDDLTISETTTPKNGSVKIKNQQIIYTPNKEFSGKDTFEYTITDGNLETSTTVTITVTEKPNSAPIAKEDETTTSYETAIKINVLSNDKDEDGDKLNIAKVATPKNGSVEIKDNALIYTPNKEFSGKDRFEYTISDGELESTSTVTVKVQEKKEQIQLPILGGGFNANPWEEVDFLNQHIDFSTKEGANISVLSNEAHQLIGTIQAGEKESKLNINIPNAQMSINANGETLIQVEGKDISIEINSKGYITPKLPASLNAVLPTSTFPLGTDVIVDKNSVKFTLPLSTDLKF